MAKLPNEIILHIIEGLIPAESSRIYPPQHPVTRTLISLTLTSKLTYQAAQQLLLKFCLYINSSKKLDKFLNYRYEYVSGDATVTSRAPDRLFLAPFPEFNLAEPHIVRQVDRLSSRISGGLRKLVIDVPLRSLYPDEDEHDVRRIIRDALCRFKALEEFCSTRDELYCDVLVEENEEMVWTLWPELRKLALYNVNFSLRFVQGLVKCRNLTHVAFTRPDISADPLPEDVTDKMSWPHLRRVVVLNTTEEQALDVRRRDIDWEAGFMGRLLHIQHIKWQVAPHSEGQDPEPLVSFVAVPVPPGREDDIIELCQEWTCNHALDGTLWDFPGTPYPK